MQAVARGWPGPGAGTQSPETAALPRAPGRPAGCPEHGALLRPLARGLSPVGGKRTRAGVWRPGPRRSPWTHHKSRVK